MTDARRLSARLRMILKPVEPGDAGLDSDLLLTPRWLLSDAARLAELVESAKTLANLYGLGSKRTAKAISALLAFDLIGSGGVDG